jgi:hypothetical protein
MAFTREKFKGRVGLKRVTSDEVDVVRGTDTSALPLNPSADNKLAYPGAFSFSDMDIAFTSSWSGSTNYTTTIVISEWFRDTDSTTT